MFERMRKQLQFVGTLGIIIGGICLINIEPGNADYDFQGPYKDSCKDCRWINAGITFSCKCKNNAGDYVEATLNDQGIQSLTWDVYNCDGTLKFKSCN